MPHRVLMNPRSGQAMMVMIVEEQARREREIKEGESAAGQLDIQPNLGHETHPRRDRIGKLAKRFRLEHVDAFTPAFFASEFLVPQELNRAIRQRSGIRPSGGMTDGLAAQTNDAILRFDRFGAGRNVRQAAFDKRVVRVQAYKVLAVRKADGSVPSGLLAGVFLIKVVDSNIAACGQGLDQLPRVVHRSIVDDHPFQILVSLSGDAAVAPFESVRSVERGCKNGEKGQNCSSCTKKPSEQGFAQQQNTAPNILVNLENCNYYFKKN